ncbi:MAG: S-layer homology domain-containing protein [Acidimicrobiia bacterium]|nr:S-layer homology domain-containing protein [Acidimicrobiia bacterium]
MLRTRTLSWWLVAAATAAVALAVLGSASAQAAPGSGSFGDDDGNTHEGMIEAIAAAGVTQGCVEGSYCPSNTVTRGQMATFIARALSLPPASSDLFSDDNGTTHEAAINSLAAAGITEGCGTGVFCPSDPVTRAQMASFLNRALNLLEPAQDYFTDDNGNTHEPAINAMAASQITLGCGGTSYCPHDAVPRDQMASFLGRGLGLVPGTRTLVSEYFQMLEYIDGNGNLVEFVDPERMMYIPRGAANGVDVELHADINEWNSDIINDIGAYAGWDLLITDPNWPHYQMNRDDFLFLALNRAATVAVVWRDEGPAPAWLQSWALRGTVVVDGRNALVYESTLPAGEHWLASPGGTEVDTKDVYFVLLAEADGTTSSAPATPSGKSFPTPNATCPAWVHDQYTTLAPDASVQPTWHPQIDPVFWCYFNHEHGSDPMLIPGAPRVGYMYVSDQLVEFEGASPESPQEGFKELIFHHPDEPYWIRYIVHASTSEPRRVCARFHTMYVEVYDEFGAQKYSAGFKTDFGHGESTDTGEQITDACAEGPDEFARRIRTDPSFDNFNYENWDASPGTTATELLGTDFRFRFDIRDPMSSCTDISCATLAQLTNPEPTDVESYGGAPAGSYARHSATRRTFNPTNFVFSHQFTTQSGEFFTDPYAAKLVSESTAGAVRQYIDPGFSLGLYPAIGKDHIFCQLAEPWSMEFECRHLNFGEDHPPVINANLEWALARPN